MKRVYLEITNACNLNCPFCTNQKGNNYMSLDDIDNYLKQIKNICDYIYLHVLGEPLLHNDFNRILDLLDKYEFKLQLVSNGLLLNNHLDILNHKCLRKLSISIHSINYLEKKEDYFNTIDYLIENNKDKNIELRFYDYENLDLDIKNYINKLENKYKLTKTKRNNSYKLKDNVYIYTNDLFKWPNINDEFSGENGTCLGIKEQIAILSNGEVTSCCLDTEGINSFGNLKDSSLKEILESDKYTKALNNLNNNKLILPLCQHCLYHHRFDKHN